MKIAHYPINDRGRDFAVGDIHGCFKLLDQRLNAIGFDPDKDRLFSVGDLVDRGPDNDDLLEWLARPWFHPVTGNHDSMAIRWPDGNMDAWLYEANGGGWNISNPPSLQREIAETLRALPLGIEVETPAGLVGIVHAECPFDDWDKFRASLTDENLRPAAIKRCAETAMWARERWNAARYDPVAGLHALVVGHTPQPYGHTVLGNVYYIDTGAVFDGGRFTILNLETLLEAA